MVTNYPMNREKPLRLSYGFKSPRLTIPLSRRLVRNFGSIIGILPCVVNNGFMRNPDPAFSQENFDIPKTETEPVVEPNCITDDFRWESMSVVP